MATVQIDSLPFETYADLATADEYLAGDFGATAWREELNDDDNKSRALVTATRILNRMPWSADRDWPRPGTDDTETGTIPQPVIDASIVLAKLIYNGSKVDDQADIATGIRRQKAGSVEVEYFIPSTEPQRLPVAVEELIAPFLATVSFGGSLASGVCEPSSFVPDYRPIGPL